MWILRKDFHYETVLTKVRRGYWAGTGSFLDPNLPLVHLLCVWLLMQKVREILDGYVWIMRRSIRSFNILLPLRTTHGSVVLARGWTIWTLPSWGEEFELEVSSLSSQEPSGAQVFILNIEVFQFEVRSSLSEGHGLEENLKNVHVLKLGRWILKVTVANFVFSKRWSSNLALGWGTILAQTDGNLNKTIFKSSNVQGLPKGGGGGLGWFSRFHQISDRFPSFWLNQSCNLFMNWLESILC